MITGFQYREIAEGKPIYITETYGRGYDIYLNDIILEMFGDSEGELSLGLIATPWIIVKPTLGIFKADPLYAMGTVTNNFDQRSYKWVYREHYGYVTDHVADRTQGDSIHPVVSLTLDIKVDASEGRDGKTEGTAWKLTK